MRENQFVNFSSLRRGREGPPVPHRGQRPQIGPAVAVLERGASLPLPSKEVFPQFDISQLRGFVRELWKTPGGRALAITLMASVTASLCVWAARQDFQAVGGKAQPHPEPGSSKSPLISGRTDVPTVVKAVDVLKASEATTNKGGVVFPNGSSSGSDGSGKDPWAGLQTATEVLKRVVMSEGLTKLATKLTGCSAVEPNNSGDAHVSGDQGDEDSSPPTPTPPQGVGGPGPGEAFEERETYVIGGDDTLWEIANRPDFFGDGNRWKELTIKRQDGSIVSAAIIDSNDLRPGDEVFYPDNGQEGAGVWGGENKDHVCPESLPEGCLVIETSGFISRGGGIEGQQFFPGQRLCKVYGAPDGGGKIRLDIWTFGDTGDDALNQANCLLSCDTLPPQEQLDRLNCDVSELGPLVSCAPQIEVSYWEGHYQSVPWGPGEGKKATEQFTSAWRFLAWFYGEPEGAFCPERAILLKNKPTEELSYGVYGWPEQKAWVFSLDADYINEKGKPVYDYFGHEMTHMYGVMSPSDGNGACFSEGLAELSRILLAGGNSNDYEGMTYEELNTPEASKLKFYKGNEKAKAYWLAGEAWRRWNERFPGTIRLVNDWWREEVMGGYQPTRAEIIEEFDKVSRGEFSRFVEENHILNPIALD